MIKKIFLIFIFLFTTSCGYESIYSKKVQRTIFIDRVIFNGDKKVDRKILSRLPVQIIKSNESGLSLNLNSKKKIISASKDSAGNTKVYILTLTVEIALMKNEKAIKTKSFESNFSYNNTSNKFDLNQYQSNIEKNLINIISEKISIYLISENDS